MKFFILFLFVITAAAFSQTETFKWEKADFLFRNERISDHQRISFDSTNLLNNLTKSFVYGYRIFISDVDGDNCPFHPSCSAFLIDAVEQNNFVQGTLMFFDRFTRDASFIGRQHRYPKHSSGKLFDPAEQYSFRSYNFVPATETVNDE